ncbi:MAG: sugar porter family MFS transporter [Chitinophagales bacterium]
MQAVALKTNAPSGSILFVTVISVVAALGGFLFGFDTAVISGALSPLISYFHLESSPVLQGWLVSSIILGSVIGAGVSGYLADNFGRKNTLMLTAILFLLSAVGSAVASSFIFFISTRLAGGLAVGIAAMVAPLYISEVSPPRIRGRMISMYQFAVTIGVLVAYFTNDYLRRLSLHAMDNFSSNGIMHWMLTDLWRGMLGSEIIPSFLFFVLLFMVPRSPRFMMMKGHEKEAMDILVRVSGEQTAKREIVEIREALLKETGSIRQLLMPGLRKATFIALFLSVVSQFSGIDIVLHYGPVIMERAGFSFANSLFGQIIFGIVLVVFTVMSMWKIDAMGRRRLLFLGNAGVFLSLLVMGWIFNTAHPSETALIVSISFFIASFAFSLGPIPWIIMAEIFPTKIRGRAMAIATLVLFAANWLIAQMFPLMSSLLGEGGMFWLLAALAIPTFFFVWKVLPETKGKSLEELETLWQK